MENMTLTIMMINMSIDGRLVGPLIHLYKYRSVGRFDRKECAYHSWQEQKVEKKEENGD
jgi:hypothetical protein